MKYSGKKYVKEELLPFFWCSGCGNGIIFAALIRAMEENNLEKKDIVAVTGIGCWGKADDYLKTHAFHGTHGRAIAVATGIKLANPLLHIFALVGDGDGATIGGNHLIHAARRNIDIITIMSNNLNYGMTGGQYSGTTPFDSITSTSRRGHAEDAFDISNLVKSAGAGYVARCTIDNPRMIQRFISKAIKKERGFRFIEVINICPTYFGRYNKFNNAVEMIKDIKERTVNIKDIEREGQEDLDGKIVVGEYIDKKVEGFLERYWGKIRNNA
ncbi:MAG TPA: thiamine pyrophosphate-dependent enzyme [Atribacterota bacterium]|nr:thiamine pyrophosphate-dependent enzyme [Atribacterota bacterium]